MCCAVKTIWKVLWEIGHDIKIGEKLALFLFLIIFYLLMWCFAFSIWNSREGKSKLFFHENLFVTPFSEWKRCSILTAVKSTVDPKNDRSWVSTWHNCFVPFISDWVHFQRMIRALLYKMRFVLLQLVISKIARGSQVNEIRG